MRHGPFLAHLVFANEKAWVDPQPTVDVVAQPVAVDTQVEEEEEEDNNVSYNDDDDDQPFVPRPRSIDNVFVMPVEDLRSELDLLGIDVKELKKPELQTALIKAVLPGIGTDAQAKSESLRRKELNQQFELAKFRLQLEAANEEWKERKAAEERKEKERVAKKYRKERLLAATEERRFVAEVRREKDRLSSEKDKLIADCKKTELELDLQRQK